MVSAAIRVGHNKGASRADDLRIAHLSRGAWPSTGADTTAPEPQAAYLAQARNPTHWPGSFCGIAAAPLAPCNSVHRTDLIRVYVGTSYSPLCKHCTAWWVVRDLPRRNNQGAPSSSGSLTMKAIATVRNDRADDTLPPLSVQEEEALCCRWHEQHDITAAERLIGCHLHVLATIATAHRGCGVCMQELIGEGYVGLMRAACRYDPACGTRFVIYATWWVQAAIQQSILCAAHPMQRDAVDRESASAMTPLFAHGERQRDSIQFVS